MAVGLQCGPIAGCTNGNFLVGRHLIGLENAMAARDRFSKKLTCPQCGNNGFAEASEDEHRVRKHPGFAVDKMPKGFFEQRSSNFQESYVVRCQCGRKFPFRALTEPAHT
jgi:hypothetical protein